MLTRTRPLVDDDWVTCPVNVPSKVRVGTTAATVEVTGAAGALLASRELGVPARDDQPCCAGPLRYQAPITNGTPSAATTLAVRAPAVTRPAPTRQRTAATTEATQTTVTIC